MAPRIDFDFDGLAGVVILRDGGALWSVQAHGIACHHPEAVGVFVPLDLVDVDVPGEVWAKPAPRPDHRPFPHLGCFGDTEAGDDDRLQLAIDGLGWPLIVDRRRWEHRDTGEAFWPVIVRHTVTPDSHPTLGAFAGCDAWLITPNCD